MMAVPWRWWSPEQIAALSGCPVGSITANWPLVADALDRRGIYEREVCAGVLGTIAIETASTFEPIDEFPDWARYPSSGGYPPHYGGGARFHGRGLLQITHDGNYRAASAVVGVDLVADPDRAKDPKIAAEIVGWWWQTKGVPAKDGSRFYTLVDLCRERDWHWTRVAVQGGTAGLDRLVRIADGLLALEGGIVAVTYNPAEPPHIQEHSYDCSQDSGEWMLWSVGRRPAESWMHDTMIAEGVMSPALGLLDASGKGMADFLNRHYGEYGYHAANEPLVTFNALASEAGRYPIMFGGRAWGHWSGLKGFDPAQDLLLLANPSPGWKGVQQTMSRAQFDALGSFSMVRLTHPDLLDQPSQPPVVVPPTPDPRDAEIAALKARVAELETIRGYLTTDVSAALQAAVDELKRHAA